ncbi:hypothetical protein PT2222_40111 [Paraburkholderia tropica]
MTGRCPATSAAGVRGFTGVRPRGPGAPGPETKSALGLDVRASVVDRLLNRRDLLGFLIRDFHAEFVFEGHHELDGVERVGAQIVHERSFVLDFSFGDAQLLGDDLLDALFDVVHYPSKGKKLAHECECAHFIRFDLAEKRRSRFRERLSATVSERVISPDASRRG